MRSPRGCFPARPCRPTRQIALPSPRSARIIRTVGRRRGPSVPITFSLSGVVINPGERLGVKLMVEGGGCGRDGIRLRHTFLRQPARASRRAKDHSLRRLLTPCRSSVRAASELSPMPWPLRGAPLARITCAPCATTTLGGELQGSVGRRHRDRQAVSGEPRSESRATRSIVDSEARALSRLVAVAVLGPCSRRAASRFVRPREPPPNLWATRELSLR